jgi:hypothetical protein
MVINMNLHHPMLLVAYVLFLSSLTSAASLNLFKVQQISNFPKQCTAAYNFDISDCSTSEITVTGKVEADGKGACSLQCIAALSFVTQNIFESCKGVQANSKTLIGLFFARQGLPFLCPNSVDGNGPAPSSTGQKGTVATPSASSAESSETSLSSTILATATSTTTSSSSDTAVAEQSTTSEASPSFQPTTAVNNGVATVFTSEAQRSDSSNPDAFGGGGSPFEVAANAASSSGRGGTNVFVTLLAVLFWSFMAGCGVLVRG